MIRDVFIPNRIGSYYLFPQRVVGVDIQPHALYATVLYIHKRTLTIEKQLMQTIPENSSPEQISQALKDLMTEVGAYDHVATTVSSSYAIFKTITLPFANKEKIGMVIGYELEPQLPFALSDAAIGFITIDVNAEQQSTEVIAVAIKKEYMEAQKNIFEMAGITPELITVDSLATFEIIKNTETFKRATHSQPTALINIKDSETEVSYLSDGKLKLIRTLPGGLYDVFKKASQKTGLSMQMIKSQIEQYGVIHNPDHSIESFLKDSFAGLVQSIAFTCNTFSQRVNFSPVQSALIIGQSTGLKDIETLIAHGLAIPALIIPTQEIMPQVSSGKTSQTYLAGFAAAHAYLSSNNANITTQESTRRDLSLFTKQIIAAGALSLLLVSFLSIFTFIQLRSWNAEYRSSLEEATQELQTIPGVKEALQNEEEQSSEESLDTIISRAKTLVKTRETLVAQFSPAHRRSMLEYLLELAKLDKDELGLNMERLTFTPGRMFLKGRVKGFNEIATVRNLITESKLFGQINPLHGLNNPEFSATITLPSRRP